MNMGFSLASMLFLTLGINWSCQPPTAPSSQPQSGTVNGVGSAAQREITFAAGASGQMIRHGRSIDFQVYESSDGVQLQISVETFRTRAQAREELKRSVANAAKVVGRPKENSGIEGKADRTVLVRRTKEPSRRAVIMWTSGRDVHSIESSSLEHALLLEKWMKY